MQARGFTAICVFVVASFYQLASTAHAAEAGFCNSYADTAVQQNQRGKTLGIANLNPPVWSDNRQGHYKWCLGVSQSLAAQNSRYRERILGMPKPAITAGPMQIPPPSPPQGPGSKQEMITARPMPLPQYPSDQPRPLSGDEIRAQLSGNTMVVHRLETGAITLVYLRQDGLVAVRAPQGQEDTGAWTIEGDLYCLQLEHLREGRKACARLVQSANQLLAYPPQGEQAVAEINILPGNPENLGMAMTGQPTATPGVGMQPTPGLPGPASTSAPGWPGSKPGMPPAVAIENPEALPEAVIQELATPLSRKAKIEALLANPKMAAELKNLAAKAGMQVDQLKHMSTTGFSFLKVPIKQMDPNPENIDWNKGQIFTPKFNYYGLYLETFFDARIESKRDKGKLAVDWEQFLLGSGPAGPRPLRVRLLLPKALPAGTYIYTLKVYITKDDHEAQAHIEVFDKDIWGSNLPFVHPYGPFWFNDDLFEKWGKSTLKVPMQNITCDYDVYKTCGFVALATTSDYRPAGYTLEFTITDIDPYRVGAFFHIAIERL